MFGRDTSNHMRGAQVHKVGSRLCDASLLSIILHVSCSSDHVLSGASSSAGTDLLHFSARSYLVSRLQFRLVLVKADPVCFSSFQTHKPYFTAFFRASIAQLSTLAQELFVLNSCDTGSRIWTKAMAKEHYECIWDALRFLLWCLAWAATSRIG